VFCGFYVAHIYLRVNIIIMVMSVVVGRGCVLCIPLLFLLCLLLADMPFVPLPLPFSAHARIVLFFFACVFVLPGTPFP
jgi:hypothetical protein